MRHRSQRLSCQLLAGVLAVCAAWTASAAPELDPLGPIPQTYAPPTGAPNPVIGEAVAAMKAGRLADAERGFRKALAQDAANPLAYFGLADVSGRRGNEVELESWLRKGVEKLPREAMLLQTLASFLGRKGQLDESEKLFERALAAGAPQAPTQVMLGEILLMKGSRSSDAEGVFRKAIAADPNFMQARIGLSRTLAGRGDAQRAKAVLNEAMTVSPKDPVPLHAMARLATTQGKLDEAIALYQRAIDLEPKFAAAFQDQGDLLLSRNEIDRAITVFRAGAAVAANPAPLLYRVGVAAQSRQRWEEAEKAYLEAIAKDPRLYGAYNNLASMAVDRKQGLDRALEHAKKAVELAPRNGAVRDTLGWVHRARGDLKGAERHIAEAIVLSPNDPTLRYHHAIVLEELGLKNDAKLELQKTLALASNFADASDVRQRLDRLATP